VIFRRERRLVLQDSKNKHVHQCHWQVPRSIYYAFVYPKKACRTFQITRRRERPHTPFTFWKLFCEGRPSDLQRGRHNMPFPGCMKSARASSAPYRGYWLTLNLFSHDKESFSFPGSSAVHPDSWNSFIAITSLSHAANPQRLALPVSLGIFLSSVSCAEWTRLRHLIVVIRDKKFNYGCGFFFIIHLLVILNLFLLSC
jgi:hypothetical protein